jgi:opacity protein-like surface antigen
LKKIKSIYLILTGSVFLHSPYFLYSQTGNKELPFYDKSKKFSIQFYGTYVSSAELQSEIDSPVPFLRDAAIELKGGYGYGGEISYSPLANNQDITFYLSTEYLKVKDDDLTLQFIQDSTSVKVRFTEEFSMIPVEGGLKWNLPVSTDRFKFYIGGGAGIYFGDRKRTISTLSTTEFSSNRYSLNIMAGSEYFIGRNISLDFEFKFREASFETENRFSQDFITVNGTSFNLGNPIHSRIIVDGVRISAGLKYHF